jgi:hypothetical protein
VCRSSATCPDLGITHQVQIFFVDNLYLANPAVEFAPQPPFHVTLLVILQPARQQKQNKSQLKPPGSKVLLGKGELGTAAQSYKGRYS